MGIRLQPKASLVRFVMNPWGRAFVLSFAVFATLLVGVFTFYYVKYARLIEDKLRRGPFGDTSLLYAAPQPVRVGDATQPAEIADYLKRVGYSESTGNRFGWYRTRPDFIEVNPGPDAYSTEGAVIKVQSGVVSQIISLSDQTERTEYDLEPELVTNLFDQKREKRRLVRFGDIPKVMVNALLSAEDKHFFQHPGFDPIGILRAAFIDLTDRRRTQGASTITQQLARTLWLGPERGWRRKLPETLITLHLEQKLTKEQIFEDYANAIYLGHQGSFSIHGFGEAAAVYLGKDLSDLKLSEAALLAGLVQSPAGRNPFRYPDRARSRRNLVLKSMRENGYIDDKAFEEAAAAPLGVKQEAVVSSDAPFFVDLVNDTLQTQYADLDFQNRPYRVYTTLDMNLQHDAVEAVRIGIEETDKAWKRRSKKYGTDELPLAQVALVALDAETGAIKALVGGRNYGMSQLDHAVAHRQPGSSFKPFVYAAAFNSALTGEGTVITPATNVVDEPTTFMFDDKPYEPADFEEPQGPVSLRYALAHSLNIPAVKVAEMVGYDKVADVARKAGMNFRIRATPAIALGAYEVTPIEIAGAYTVFPNNGMLVKPNFIQSIRDISGGIVRQPQVEKRPAIDPRVAYLTLSVMQEVLRSGTGAGVRGRGFGLPAAGKTGTSRDGWFAGFTSKLITVVWVGFDDNRDFKLEGARSALPIWTEFIKRAHQRRGYRSVHEFEAPEGIVTLDIDPATGQLATPQCPRVASEVFIAGTQPVESCRLHGGGGVRTQIAGWDPVKDDAKEGADVMASNTPPPARARAASPRPTRVEPAKEASTAQLPKEKPKGFLGRLRALFGR